MENHAAPAQTFDPAAVCPLFAQHRPEKIADLPSLHDPYFLVFVDGACIREPGSTRGLRFDAGLSLESLAAGALERDGATHMIEVELREGSGPRASGKRGRIGPFEVQAMAPIPEVVEVPEPVAVVQAPAVAPTTQADVDVGAVAGAFRMSSEAMEHVVKMSHAHQERMARDHERTTGLLSKIADSLGGLRAEISELGKPQAPAVQVQAQTSAEPAPGLLDRLEGWMVTGGRVAEVVGTVVEFVPDALKDTARRAAGAAIKSAVGSEAAKAGAMHGLDRLADLGETWMTIKAHEKGMLDEGPQQVESPTDYEGVEDAEIIED
jgi:hypothetical protein